MKIKHDPTADRPVDKPTSLGRPKSRSRSSVRELLTRLIVCGASLLVSSQQTQAQADMCEQLDVLQRWRLINPTTVRQEIGALRHACGFVVRQWTDYPTYAVPMTDLDPLLDRAIYPATDYTTVKDLGVVPHWVGSATVYPFFNVNYVIVCIAGCADPNAPKISSLSPPPNATNNQRYSHTLRAVAGTAPFDWRVVSNSLPPGLTLAPASGIISGRPTAEGEFGFTVKLTDSRKGTDKKGFTLKVFPGPPVPRSPLTLRTNGCGSVAGATNGQWLEVDQSYAVTASPCTDFLFSHWSGGLSSDSSLVLLSNSTNLVFVMRSNLVLEANFVANPFVAVKGTYRGLFYEPEEAHHESSGAFTLTLKKSGAYSATLETAGQSYPLSGKFNLDGKATNTLACCGSETLTVEWALDLDHTSTNYLTGRLIPGSGTWEAQLIGDRAPAYGTSSSPYRGKYTVIFPGTREAAITDRPVGDGYAAATVDAGGMITLAGRLADGKLITHSAQVSTNGFYPLYVPLHAGKGMVLSWVQLNTLPPPANRLVGDRLLWERPAISNAAYYPEGFELVTSAVGTKYKASSPVLPFTNGFVVFLGGNLLEPLTNRVKLTASNTVINRGPQPLTMTVTSSNGLFQGAVTLPGAMTPVAFQGAILQSQTNGYGFFRNAGHSGWVIFGPAP